jgi:hypothetical protein
MLTPQMDKQRDLENRLSSERQGRLNLSDKLDEVSKVSFCPLTAGTELMKRWQGDTRKTLLNSETDSLRSNHSSQKLNKRE